MLTSRSELLTFVIRAWCQGFLEWCLKTDSAGTASEIGWWESERERNCIFLLFSKIVKILTLDIFLNQCDTYMFVKVVHENQSGNHCNQSNTQPSFLQELYQQTTSSLPHLEHTHTTHTLPLYCIFSFISVFWEPVKQNSSQNVSQAQVQES